MCGAPSRRPVRHADAVAFGWEIGGSASRAMSGRAFDALARQQALRDPVWSELVPGSGSATGSRSKTTAMQPRCHEPPTPAERGGPLGIVSLLFPQSASVGERRV